MHHFNFEIQIETSEGSSYHYFTENGSCEYFDFSADFSENRLFCNKFAEFLGKESLALIVWQFLVLQSLNVFLYNSFYSAGMDGFVNIAVNFVINISISLVLTWVSSKTITPLTNYTCNRVNALLFKK